MIFKVLVHTLSFDLKAMESSAFLDERRGWCALCGWGHGYGGEGAACCTFKQAVRERAHVPPLWPVRPLSCGPVWPMRSLVACVWEVQKPPPAKQRKGGSGNMAECARCPSLAVRIQALEEELVAEREAREEGIHNLRVSWTAEIKALSDEVAAEIKALSDEVAAQDARIRVREATAQLRDWTGSFLKQACRKVLGGDLPWGRFKDAMVAVCLEPTLWNLDQHGRRLLRDVPEQVWERLASFKALGRPAVTDMLTFASEFYGRVCARAHPGGRVDTEAEFVQLATSAGVSATEARELFNARAKTALLPL